MSYLSIFLVSFMIALSGALMPGPLLAAVIYESTRHGFKAGPLFIFGHALLEVLMVAFIVFGFARFLNTPLMIGVITVAGSLILIYFGIMMIVSLPRLSLALDSYPGKSTNLVWSGITTSLANPYWTIWWLTIGIGLVLAAQKQGWLAILVFFAGHILADLGWYCIVALMISKGRDYFTDRIYRGIVLLCAISLIGFAAWFIFHRTIAAT